MDVKRTGGEVVEFEPRLEAELRIVCPVFDRVKRPIRLRGSDIEAERPGERVVDEGEALFCESKDFLFAIAEKFRPFGDGVRGGRGASFAGLGKVWHCDFAKG